MTTPPLRTDPTAAPLEGGAYDEHGQQIERCAEPPEPIREE